MPDVTMPQLGETVTEGTITRWMKAVGEPVTRDEPLFEVSTDKVDSEVPAPASGVLQQILVPEGETVEVGTRLAVIGDGAGAAPAPPAQPADAPAPGAAPPPPVPAPAPESTAPAPAAAAPSVPPPIVPAVPPPPPPGFSTAAATAPEVRPAATPRQGPGEDGDHRLLSPVVRRLLAENGIDPLEITGTGVGGRITREDVLTVIDARRAGAAATAAAAPSAPAPAPSPARVAPAPAAASPAPPTPAPAERVAQPPTPTRTAPASVPPTSVVAAPMAAPSPPPPPPQGPSAPAVVLRPPDERIVPFSNMRRRTAEHMVRSKATSPHAYIATEADFENVERVRRTFGERFRAEEGFSLTYLPFVARAMVEALREFPNLNASVADDALVVHQQINLGIAVDLDHEGLIVPVVHRAEEVTLRGVARRIRDLADRARTRQLRADDIAGGTISITNDGPFGTYFTVPIINQPQVAILATDGVTRRPVVVTLPDGTEAVAIHSMGLLGMSWDHRAVDGAYVASFLAKVVELLAGRDWAAEL